MKSLEANSMKRRVSKKAERFDIERAILSLKRLARATGTPPVVIEEAIRILERDQGPPPAAAAAALPMPGQKLPDAVAGRKPKG